MRGWTSFKAVAFFAANPDELLTVKDASAKFGIGIDTIRSAMYRLVQEGVLESKDIGETHQVYTAGPHLLRMIGR
jgi:Fic family protein